MKTGDDDARRALDAQREHWERTFAEKASMFGDGPSAAGRASAEAFQSANVKALLELGAGQGRDTLLFAQSGFDVTALDYTSAGAAAIQERAAALSVAERVRAVRHDIRTPFPFADGTFDACYSHMLFCMALTMAELERLSGEVRRVLRPGGLCVYTVRTTDDPQFGTGVLRGPDMFEIDGGFIVHFFDDATVRQLAAGWRLVSVERGEEGSLPRRLFLVTMRKE